MKPSCDVDQDGLIDALGVASQPIEPDDLESFELGMKTSFADNRVTLNASIYRINWQGIPVSIATPHHVSCPFYLMQGNLSQRVLRLKLRSV